MVAGTCGICSFWTLGAAEAGVVALAEAGGLPDWLQPHNSTNSAPQKMTNSYLIATLPEWICLIVSAQGRKTRC
jgi:hypothetical protein